MTHCGATEMAFESYSPDIRDRACLLQTTEKKNHMFFSLFLLVSQLQNLSK